jgi:outer membrane protein TolC
MFILAFLLLPSLSLAAEMSLTNAVSAALQQSPEVQRAASQVEESHWRKIESYSSYLPRIQASGNYLLDKKYLFTDIPLNGNMISIPGIVPTTIFQLSGTLSLFDGFASTERLHAATQMNQAAEDDLRWTKFKLERTVALEYYRALATRTLHKVAENNFKTLNDHLRDVRAFRRSGLSTNYDVLRVEVQVSAAEAEVMNSEDNVEVAATHLGEILGIDGAIEPTGNLPELKPALADKVQIGAADRPDIQALGKRVEGFDDLDSAASRHWVPRLSAFGSYQYYNNRNDDFDDWRNFRNAYQVGLNLTWDLFDGFADMAKRRQAMEQKVQSEKSLRIAQLKAKEEGARWLRKFKYFCSVFKSRQNDVQKSEESVRLAREGRKVGARTNTDLLDAEADLYRSQAGAVTAQLGAIEALINLELSTGQALYHFQ